MARQSFTVKDFTKLEVIGTGTITINKASGSNQASGSIFHQYEYAPMIYSYVKVGNNFYPLPYQEYDADGLVTVSYGCLVLAKAGNEEGEFFFTIDVPINQTATVNTTINRTFSFFVYKERRTL